MPHGGCQCIGMHHAGDGARFTCEMCGNPDVRYVHTMRHADWPDTIDVGCVCAEHMEQDPEAPKKRERSLRRRANWPSRRWRVSSQGNGYLNTDGFNVVVYPQGRGYGFRVRQRDQSTDYDDNGDFATKSNEMYSDKDKAKLAAFDAMLALKGRKGS
jgi:hypothetical protein